LSFYLGDERETAAFEACIPLAREQGDATSLARALANLADVAMHTGDYAEASRLGSESLAVARADDATTQIALALEVLAEAGYRGGDSAPALEHLHEALMLYARVSSQFGVARVLETIAVLTSSTHATEATRLYATADRLRRRAGIPILTHEQPFVDAGIATARASLGEDAFSTVWQAGRERGVEDAIQEGLALAMARASGEAPETRSTSTGAHGLTPRELDVLRLIVEGLSDREIAERLFISHRTVMRHVTNILNTLGVNSRTAAATFAVRQGIV
jgi:DNA-binding CsgD family transcriptional regulator